MRRLPLPLLVVAAAEVFAAASGPLLLLLLVDRTPDRPNDSAENENCLLPVATDVAECDPPILADWAFVGVGTRMVAGGCAGGSFADAPPRALVAALDDAVSTPLPACVAVAAASGVAVSVDAVIAPLSPPDKALDSRASDVCVSSRRRPPAALADVAGCTAAAFSVSTLERAVASADVMEAGAVAGIGADACRCTWC